MNPFDIVSPYENLSILISAPLALVDRWNRLGRHTGGQSLSSGSSIFIPYCSSNVPAVNFLICHEPSLGPFQNFVPRIS
jgi:hypothetical protein